MEAKKTEAQAAAEAKRAKLKAETKKTATGALYLIPEGGQNFYRQGVTVLPGSIVELPLAEDPSVTWLAVEDKPAAVPVAAKAATPGGARRPSDKDV